MNAFKPPYEISIATTSEAEVLHNKLDKFNADQLAFKGQMECLLDFIVKDHQSIIAGVRGCFYLEKCLFVNILFVDEKYRHKKLGSLLLNKVETEAKVRGATLAHLDTFDFQAKEFYHKQGYEVFGTLEDCPPGHTRYYMKKKL